MQHNWACCSAHTQASHIDEYSWGKLQGVEGGSVHAKSKCHSLFTLNVGQSGAELHDEAMKDSVLKCKTLKPAEVLEFSPNTQLVIIWPTKRPSNTIHSDTDLQI